MQKLLEDIKTFGYKVPKDPELMLYDFYFMAGHMPHSHEDKVLDFVFKEALNDCTTALQKHMLAALYWALSVELRHIWQQSELQWTTPRDFDRRARGLSDISKRFLKEFTKANSVYENDYIDTMDPIRKPAKLAKSRTVASLNTNVADEMNPRNKIGKSKGREESYVSSFLSVEKARKNLKLSKKEAVNCIRELYGNVDWDRSYGGDAWAAIAEAYLKLANASTPQERIVYIDHAYDLQHNTGSVFTKVRPYYKNSSLSWMAAALDWKRDAEDLRGFYAKVSSSLKPVVAWVAKNQHDMTMEDFNPEKKSSGKTHRVAPGLDGRRAYSAEEIQRMHLEKKDAYQIGDEVIISPDISTRTHYKGNTVNTVMLKYAGQKAKIIYDHMPSGYELAIQGEPIPYLWTPDMLAGKVPSSEGQNTYTAEEIQRMHLEKPGEYKIGDEVIIRPDLISGKKYGNYAFSSVMVPSKGKKAKIVGDFPAPKGYFLEVDGHTDPLLWTPEMFAGKIPRDTQQSKSKTYTAKEIQRMHLEKKDTYEVGDEVIISPDLSTQAEYDGGIVAVKNMLKFAGQKAQIIEMKSNGPPIYKLAIQGEPIPCLWTPEMFAGKVPGSRKKEAVTMAQVGSKILANPTHFAKNMSQIQDFRISDKPHSIKNAEDLLYNLATDKQRGRVLPDNVVTQLKNLTNKHGTLKAAIAAWLKANPDAYTLLSELLRQGVTASQLSQADTGALRKTGTASQLQKAVRRF